LEVGHTVLNPHGDPIRISSGDMAKLRKMGLLHKRRDLDGAWQISMRYFDLVLIGQAFFVNVLPRPLKVSNYEPAGRPKKGCCPSLVTSLGTDCSGPNTVPSGSSDYQRMLEDLDRTSSPYDGRGSG
jgi:hypothetical protein